VYNMPDSLRWAAYEAARIAAVDSHCLYSVVEIGAPLTPDLVLCIMCEFTASAGIKTARH